MKKAPDLRSGAFAYLTPIAYTAKAGRAFYFFKPSSAAARPRRNAFSLMPIRLGFAANFSCRQARILRSETAPVSAQSAPVITMLAERTSPASCARSFAISTRERDYQAEMYYTKLAWIDGLNTSYKTKDGDIRYLSLDVNSHIFA